MHIVIYIQGGHGGGELLPKRNEFDASTAPIVDFTAANYEHRPPNFHRYTFFVFFMTAYERVYQKSIHTRSHQADRLPT